MSIHMQRTRRLIWIDGKPQWGKFENVAWCGYTLPEGESSFLTRHQIKRVKCTKCLASYIKHHKSAVASSANAIHRAAEVLGKCLESAERKNRLGVGQ